MVFALLLIAVCTCPICAKALFSLKISAISSHPGFQHISGKSTAGAIGLEAHGRPGGLDQKATAALPVFPGALVNTRQHQAGNGDVDFFRLAPNIFPPASPPRLRRRPHSRDSPGERSGR